MGDGGGGMWWWCGVMSCGVGARLRVVVMSRTGVVDEMAQLGLEIV